MPRFAASIPGKIVKGASAVQITDAQIHVWGSGLPSNAAHRQVTRYDTEEAVAMMDEGGVDAAIIHPVGWDPGSPAMAAKAVADYPGRFAIMGSVPLSPASAPLVATWRDQPGMLGLRWSVLHDKARTEIADGTLDPLWAACERHSVPISLLCTDSLKDLDRIARAFPALRITVDHLGGRGGNEIRKDHAAMTHMPDLLALAKHANVAVKATGAPGYSAEAYPFPIMLGYLRQIFDAFGPARMFWGTDITKMPCSWRLCVQMFTDHMPWLNEADKRLMMGDGIRAFWGWH